MTSKKQQKPKTTLRFFGSVFSGILAVILLFWLISTGLLGYIPTFEELENPNSNLASEIYSEDGALLGKYYFENRSNTRFSELDANLVTCSYSH